MLYAKRERFEKLSRAVGRLFSKFPLEPNQWTLLSLVPALLGFYLLVSHTAFLGAAGLYLLAAFLDFVDGAVARHAGKTSKEGAYLDTVVDRYVEFLILFALVFLYLPDLYIPSSAWIVLLLFGSLLTTYSKSAAKEKELTDKELRGGLLERAERVTLLLLSLVLAKFEPLWTVYILAALAVFTNISALQRIVMALTK
ncbi:MAG: CDP-alcohol phosphatidyltransferase family protein [Candidatus Aenigmatarchaeota archaeon]